MLRASGRAPDRTAPSLARLRGIVGLGVAAVTFELLGRP